MKKINIPNPSEWERMSLEEKVDWLFYNLVINKLYESGEKKNV